MFQVSMNITAAFLALVTLRKHLAHSRKEDMKQQHEHDLKAS